jgi:serine/threonine protein kinase
MNDTYEAFCMTDALFYDAPGNASPTESFTATQREAPSGWARATSDHWVNYAPQDGNLPEQGWKIHVSGCRSNAEHIIETVWSYCVPRGIAFKFLRSPRIFLARNAKYAGRGGSGKLVTIYPRDDAELELVCKDLDESLGGEPGPYILSDLRWNAGPLHVRYGGFTPRHCTDENGEEVPAIADASGKLVPDVRGPVFVVPSWVTLPDVLAPHLAARSAVTLKEVPYDVEQALHFSNGGGVYLGRDRRTGEKVVLKEARPYAGLSGDGADAVARLRREHDTLERLAGIPAVPRLLDHLTVGDHEFLVMEHIEGEPLNKMVAHRCPLLEDTIDPDALAGYATWARSIHDQVSAAVREIHGRGVLYGDLHLFNVMVRPDDTVALIDFEVSSQLDGGQRPGLGAGGFTAPRDRHGADIDLYALACLQLSLFLPLVPLLGLDRTKAVELADVIAANFPVERSWLDHAVRVITGSEAAAATSPARWVWPEAPVWPAGRDALAGGILASATPERDDRLFPGDPAQFWSPLGGLALAHGAAGVLYALDAVGVELEPEHRDWLLRHTAEPVPAGRELRLGFYDGLSGIAYVLARLGHDDEAARLLERCLEVDWARARDDLHGGLAGLGLAFAHFADLGRPPGQGEDTALGDAARQATAQVADRLGGVDDVPTTSGGRHPYAGLLHGSAGKALLFVRMYERTGDTALLDLAATALRQDLRRCVRRGRSRSLHVDEGFRTMPYLQQGSVGIGLVLDRYLAHRGDDELAEASRSIRAAACSFFYVLPGLFSGRAGMVLYLSDRQPSDGEPDDDLRAQIDRLSWHALDHQGHLVFPGDRMLRLSTDLATGSAGVLLALGAALHDAPVHLPFLGGTGPTILDTRGGGELK